MDDSTMPMSYKGFRYPVEIIAHAVWLPFRFNLSYREVEEFLAARGVVVTYETIRQWCLKFGQTFANQLRHRRVQPDDKWHCDEVFLKINGKQHYVWRAVDQDGHGLDILVQSRPNKAAAIKFFRKPGAVGRRAARTFHACSSRTNSRATEPPSARCSRAWNIARAAISSTELKTPTN